MFLKVMKKLTNFFLFLLCTFCVFSQTVTFKGNLENQFESEISFSNTNLNLSIHPRIFASVLTSNKYTVNHVSLLGLGIKTNYSKKLRIIASYDKLDGLYNHLINNYQDSLGIYYPGFGLGNTRMQLNVRYLTNKFITLDFGRDKHFIGNGYQSLLLSNLASAYPYFKVTTKFGPIKYYNLYTTFINPDMIDNGRKKHSTIHYLDLAINNKINIGVFESILWQSKSEEVNTGYEIAYLNPVIFYRPVEFSKQSSKGNALMGANFNARLKNIMIYGQIVLDDLNISRQKDTDENYTGGFFQNKYGFQFGIRYKNKGINSLFEYNQVQPYTYGHRTILQNYSHSNQALAHPLGANFKEFIGILELSNERLTYKVKTIFTSVGLDSLNTHYGQNIFESDLNASTGGQYSYGNFNGQGVSTLIFSLQPEISYKLKDLDLFCSLLFRKKISDLHNQTVFFYSIGLRTFLFSKLPDY